MQHRYIVTELK